MKKMVVLLCLVLIFAGGHKLWRQTHPIDFDWQKSSFYSGENKHVGDPGMEFFGDSIVYFWGKTSYSAIMQKSVDRGIPGQTTSQMVIRFRQDVINLHPRTVVILAGTDDLLQGYRQQTTESNIETMVELAKDHGIRPILCSVLPMSPRSLTDWNNYAPQVQQLNAWIKTYATEQNLAFIDFYPAFKDDRGGMIRSLSADGIHPNAAGYQILESIFPKQEVAILPQ